MSPSPSCEAPRELTVLGQPLPRLAEALRGPGDVSIVAKPEAVVATKLRCLGLCKVEMSSVTIASRPSVGRDVID
jgi:hypothetical protein